MALSGASMVNSASQFGDSVMAAPEDPSAQPQRMTIRFTGSGSEYFRIWIVNLLLTVLTLSLYYPWAKVRRLRYFYGNTLVDGAPLGFHGDPRKMLRGYLLVAVLFGLYSVAGKISLMAGFLALLVIAVIAPALFRSSMRFRLGNTSWRGLRFSFGGSTRDAYRALVPFFVPGVLLIAPLAFAASPDTLPVWYVFFWGATVLFTIAVLPWVFWNLKRYQHEHYGLADLQTSFKASVGSFYRLVFKCMGVAVLAVFAPIVVFLLAAFLLKGSDSFMGISRGPAGVLAMSMLPLLFILSVLVIGKSYMTSRLQNLVWTKTGNRSMRFLSALSFSALARLTLKNWLLMLVTLGLYWPFAAVATTRLRLEAVAVKTRYDPAMLVSRLAASATEAAGDAAGDLLGLDIGL